MSNVRSSPAQSSHKSSVWRSPPRQRPLVEDGLSRLRRILTQDPPHTILLTVPSIDWWQWVERTTWLVTMAGVVVAILTLWLIWKEQRRIGNELSRRPRIRLGFVIPDRVLHPRNFAVRRILFRRAEGDAQHRVGFGLANEGERTAFGLIHELVFPASVESVESWDGRGYDDASGFHHLLWGPDDLHPRSGMTHYAYVMVRPNIARVPVKSIATFQDSPKIENEIEIVLQRLN